jgi:hypothetical protein
MSDIEARVKKIIAEQLGVEESQVTNEKAFVADLGADSLDTVVGFDGDRRARRSGPRTHGYLANDPCKPIGADNKRTDFALAA